MDEKPTVQQQLRGRARDLAGFAREMSVERRGAFVTAACGGNADLRVEIETLLAGARCDETGTAETALGPGDPAAGAESLIGRDIGGYRVKRIIASGGMGTVYLAVQKSPPRPVALKVMKAGLDSSTALKRFQYESQILGRLRHRNVAQVYEAGTHDVGQGAVPYFAMEYIPDARTILRYADDNVFGLRGRIRLFLRVVDAVHHGHQKGIVHRDLKPANILVDSSGEPKIIDFGIARSLDSDVLVTTFQTGVGQLLGTLQYMSPEQCAGDPHDIDTRSDIYSMGVVLHELLCDELPYDVHGLPIDEAMTLIREARPPRPGTRNRTLRGDPETIVLKALEKERERRYQSASALAADLGRLLNYEPISARPPSAGYRFRMYTRRHRSAVLATKIAMALIVVSGIIYATILLRGSAEMASRKRELRDIRDQNTILHRRVEDLEEETQRLERELELVGTSGTSD